MTLHQMHDLMVVTEHRIAHVTPIIISNLDDCGSQQRVANTQLTPPEVGEVILPKTRGVYYSICSSRTHSLQITIRLTVHRRICRPQTGDSSAILKMTLMTSTYVYRVAAPAVRQRIQRHLTAVNDVTECRFHSGRGRHRVTVSMRNITILWPKCAR